MKKLRLLSVYTLLLIGITNLSSCGDDDSQNDAGLFEDQSFRIEEGANPGTIIGVIPGGQDLEILSGNDEALFSIDGNDQIVLEGLLDFEETASYSLRVSACSDENGESCEEVNVTIEVTALTETELSFNNESFDITGGQVSDYGATDFDYLNDGGSETHYRNDFIIYDGIVTSDGNLEGNLLSYGVFLSPGTASFQTGTFKYQFPGAASEVENEFYFDYLEISYDGNNNNTILETDDDLAEDILFLAYLGTVEVINNDDENYTLNYNVEAVQIDLIADDVVAGTETTFEFSVTLDLVYADFTNAARRVSTGLRPTLDARSFDLQ